MTPLFPCVLAALILVSPAEAGDVRLKAADGASLAAEHLGSGDKGVLLVHGSGRSRADFENFGNRLAKNGFSVLLLDLRGHGASGGELPEEPWTPLVADVRAGISWLAERGTVAVVGSELGANLALNAAAESEVANLVLLSPSLNAHGVTVSAAIGAWTGPLLVVADEGDPASARAATLLAEKAGGRSRVELVDANASGHRMLNTVPELEATLVGWLNGATGASDATLAKPDRTLEAGDIGTIETTGEHYGDTP